MSEIRLANPITAQPTEDKSAPTAENDIQVLSDLELALAGGGDQVVPWP